MSQHWSTHQYFMQELAAGAPTSNGVSALQPFAVVDEVSEHSPASTAGVMLGDQLCRFGAVTAQSNPAGVLQAVAAELQVPLRAVQKSAYVVPLSYVVYDCPGVQRAGDRAVVWRRGIPVTVSLTPQQWVGRGLLGCHLRALQ